MRPDASRPARARSPCAGRAVACIAIACGAAGCGGDVPQHADTTRDSAGVAIVTAPLPLAEAGISVETVPALDIGGRAGDPRYDLVNTADAIRLGDGRIVIAVDGAAEVRYYDADGTHRLTIGRRGDGPGEFRGIGHLFHGGGDTVMVYDYQLRRVTTIAPDGSLGPTRPVEIADARAAIEPVARLADGSWVGVSGAFLESPSPDIQRDTIGVVHLSADLHSLLDRIGRFPGTEQYVTGSSSADRRSFQSVSVPFGAGTHVAAQGHTIWVGDAARFEMRAYAADARLIRIVRIAAALRPVTSADVQRARDAELSAAEPEARAGLLRRWERIPVPRHHPAFGAVSVDAAGRLWLVERRTVQSDSTPAHLFTENGRGIATVMLPANFSMTEAGADYILGIWTDADDVEHVRLYRLSSAVGG